MKRFTNEQFEGLGGLAHSLIAGALGVIAHMDTCASILAVIVLILQIRVMYHRSVTEKLLERKAKDGS